MKNKKLFTLILTSYIGLNFITNAQTPNWQWAKSAGGNGYDNAGSIATDANGNLLVTGSFNSSSITFGSTTLTNADTSGNTADIFLVKYDALGNVQWAKSAGGTYNDKAWGIATDASGNVLVTGGFDSPAITFGSITLSNTAITGDTTDIFLVKYDASGNLIWGKANGGINADESFAIATDANGNVLVTGRFLSPSITFGSTTLTSAGYISIFIVKYDVAGNVLWAKSAGATDPSKNYGITTDIGGNVFVTGHFVSSSITFGSTTLTNTDITGATSDIYIVKYDALGNVLWAKSAGGINADYGNSISTDASGNVLVTGDFNSPVITFGSDTLTNVGFADIFIVKYDPAGNVLWAKSAGGTNPDYSNGISTDGSGNVFITGEFQSSSITFGSTTLINTDITANTEDVLVAKYDASGNVLWAKSAAGTSMDFGFGITTDASGNALVTGSFRSPAITFGTTVLTNVNVGYLDIFVAKLSGFTGISEETISSKAVDIFPNPSNGPFNISSSTLIDEIEITNMLGQNIYLSKPKEKNVMMQLDIAGVYFVKVTNGEKQFTQKIIIQ